MSQENFSVKWMVMSIVIFIIAEVVLKIALGIFAFLTFGIGAILFLVLKPLVYLVGGIVTGYLSPGITIKEPAIGAALAVILGALFERGGNLLFTLIGGVVAFGLALAGAKIGERAQGNQVE